MLNKFAPILIVLVVIVAACTKKQSENDEAATARKEWKEMDDFHMVMAEAFHPFKDSSNLQPAREHASTLVSSAKEWRASKTPEGVSEEMEPKLDRLVEMSEEFSSEVLSGTDESVASKLTALHDLFHDLQNDFYGGASGGHHDGHHEH